MATFDLVDLDAETRRLMSSELDSDIGAGCVYTSRRARSGTEDAYHDALRQAFEHGDPQSLCGQLVASGIFLERQSDGKIVNVLEAASVLGDGQFVAYYSRAVCLRAMDANRAIEVYRGQETAERRADSEELVGTRPDPEALLDELREFSLEPWKYTTVGKPNSGLVVKLV